MAFQNLSVVQQYRIQVGDRLAGLCCDGDTLYCVEKQGYDTNWLTAYDISGALCDGPRLLDRLDLKTVAPPLSPLLRMSPCHPRVDSNSHRVYVPCMERGIWLVHHQNGRLQPDWNPLRFWANSGSVAVNTADSIYVCDYVKRSVCLVKVYMPIPSMVIRRLDTPGRPANNWFKQKGNKHHTDVANIPHHVSVLEGTVLVSYDQNTLMAYRSDSAAPVHVLPELGYTSMILSSITTDSHSSFVITDKSSNSLVVLDKAGNILHRIQPDTDSGASNSGGLIDCAVLQSQLWLGYEDGAIAVMSSR